MEKKKIKTIRIDVEKCNGCRACEVICSAFHANPKYSCSNTARARIRVHFDPLRNVYVPVFSTFYTPAECASRSKYVLNGEEHDECAFCGASCPSREYFKEPDSGLPLKCDCCEDDPPLEKPMCVQWCLDDALTYEEREEEAKEEVNLDELETGLEALIDRFGRQKVADAFARLSQKD
ncbi:MAG: (4Fe-4S)-binding protein [Desulfotomaculales bacterium]